MLKELQNEIKALSNSDIALHSQRFFKTGKGEYGEGDVFLGIRVPALRKLAKKYHLLPLDQIEKLLHSKYHEERLLAAIMLRNCFEKSDTLQQKEIYTLYVNNTSYLNNWDIIDISAPNIVGAYLWDKDRKILHTFARSKSLWKNRISLLATFYFIRNKDYTDSIIIAETLLNHPHDLIHKACGWMLREIGNRNTAEEEKFLKTHYKTMPRTMLRYAIEKFPEKRRKAYLLGEI